MIVTVAICTWNRSRLLNHTLRGMVGLGIPAGIEWELLVVNNHCTDDTCEVVSSFAKLLPIQALHEPRQGLSNARNRALVEAKGELLLWLDDDVQIGTDWLADYVRAGDRYPNAAYFGGPVRPWFPVAPPRWLERQYHSAGWIWALLDPGLGEGILPPGQPVFGANMGYRTEVLRRYSFDPALGHVGATPGGGDEVSIQDKIQRDGGDGVWLPDTSVNHYVPPERMTLDFVWKRAFADGRCLYSPQDAAKHTKVAGIPRWMIREYALAATRCWAGRITRSKSWLASFVQAARLRGAITAAREVSRSANQLAGGSR